MGYITKSFSLFVVLLTFSSSFAGSKGGGDEDIHFKINVPTFIKKIKHTKTVYVHKNGGGGGGGGGHGGGEHKISPPKSVTGYIIDHEHKKHGKKGGDHASFTLHNSYLQHGGHSSSAALHLGNDHGEHDGHGGSMPASYMGLDSYGKPPTHSALLAGHSGRTHGELVHPPPPPPPPTHEHFDEGDHTPTVMSQALVRGPSGGHFPGHEHFPESGLHSLGAHSHLGGGGGGFPPHEGGLHQETHAAIADRPEESSHDSFDIQYEGSGFPEGGDIPGTPLPGFKRLPSVHNGHANAPYGDVSSFATENSHFNEEHIPSSMPSYPPTPSYNPGTFGSAYRNNMARNYNTNQYRTSRQAHVAPPVIRNNYPAPTLNQHMYNSYEEMVEKVVENMFSGKQRGSGNQHHPHPHSYPQPQPHHHHHPHSFPQRRYHLELEETPQKQHKPRSTSEFHKSSNKKKPKSKAKRKHTSKGILVNLVKKRVDD